MGGRNRRGRTVLAGGAVLLALGFTSAAAQEAAAPTPTPVATVAPELRPAPLVEAERHLLAYRTKEARAALEPVKDDAASDPAVAVALGRVLEQEKKYADAVTQLKKAAALAATDPAAQLWLGETLLRQKKAADATAAFKKAAELAGKAVAADEKDAHALYLLGVAQQRLKLYDKAVEALGKAREVDAGNPLVSYQLGVTRAFQQKWADAVTELTKATDADSGIAYAYYYRALAQDKLGKKDQLVLDMERFLALAAAAPEAEQAAAIVKAAKR